MAEKKAKEEESKALALSEKAAEIPAALVLAHPAVKELATRLENVQRVLEQLPEVIGRAVASAIRNQPPPNASGPAMPVVPFGGALDVVLEPQKMTVGGKSFELPPKPGFSDELLASNPALVARPVPLGACPTATHKKGKR